MTASQQARQASTDGHAGPQHPSAATGERAGRCEQIGADYPFNDAEACRSSNDHGSILHGWRFRQARV